MMDAMLKYNDLEGKRITKNIKYRDIDSKVSVEGRIIEVNIYIYIKIRYKTISIYDLLEHNSNTKTSIIMNFEKLFLLVTKAFSSISYLLFYIFNKENAFFIIILMGYFNL